MIDKTTTEPLSELLFQQSDESKQTINNKLSNTLRAIRAHLGMDVAFVSEFSNGRRYFRHVDSPHANQPVCAGNSDPLEESYCQRVVDGRLPQLIHDASKIPAALELPVTVALPVGAHLSVPITFKDGHVYGTLCCFSFTPDLSLNERDLGLMRVFADLTAEQIEDDVKHRDIQLAMETRVHEALSGEIVSIMYQPIYNMAEDKTVGFEALSRFSSEPYRSPDIWFSEAAQVDLGTALELKAIDLALQAMEQFPPTIYVSVNISPETILSGEFDKLLEGRALDRILLEVTEHASVEYYEDLAEKINPFRDKGLRIAVDDAGAGFASFRHILSLAPDVIKLDMSITRNIDTDNSRRALAAAFISFARATNCKIVAEGVETSSELSTLRQLGVNKAQGYFLGKPSTLTSAIELLSA